nr:hypothetical protein [Tanacetum cinerariifolium]
MDMTIDQQVALDEALIPHARRLRFGKRNFCLRSHTTSKESTLQLVYDVLRLTPFYKAFLVTVDVPEIYMQEFWATVTVHHHSMHFKMNNKKRIVNLEYFREMLHISPRLPNQTFDELPFEEEIMAFLRYPGHSREIRKLTDVNINKLHQPRRSFAAVINKCLSGKSIGYDSLRKILYIKLSTKRPRRAMRCTIPGAAPPKTKASVRKMQSSFNTTMPPPTAVSTRLSTLAKGKQPAKSSKAKDDNDDDQDTDNDSDDFVNPKLSIHEEEAKDEESFDPIVQTLENSDDEGNDDASLGMNVGGEEGQDAEDDDEELYRDVNINQEGRDSSSVSSQFVTSMLNRSPDAGIDSLFESTPRVDVQASTTVVPITLTAPTLPPPTIPTISQVPQAPTPPTTAPSTFLQDLLNFGSLFGFNHRLKTLEANFSEFVQTNQFVKVAVQIQSDRLRDEAQAKNEEFFNNLDENIQKIIKEQVKEQVKVEVSKILLKIKKTVNEQLEAKVLTQSSNSSNTSYVVAADLSEIELKKILIEKIESNKRHDDADKDEEPSARSDRRSMRRGEGKEPESTSAPKEKATKTTVKSTQGSKSHQKTASDDLAKQADSRSSSNELMHTRVDFSAFLMNRLKVDTLTLELLAGLTYELMKGSCNSLIELEFFLEEVYKATTDQLDWNNPEGQEYPHNLLKPLPLIPNSRGHRVIPFDHFINNDLEYLHGGAFSRKYITSVTKTKEANYGHIKWIEDLVSRTIWSQELVSYDKYALWGISHWGCKRQQFYGFVVNTESARDIYLKRSIIAVTELQIVEWHDYKHLDWITVRRDDDKLYKFKEGNFKRLRIQDIEDMLLLLVQGKLTNLTVEERFAFNIYLRMFTRSIVIQRRVKDL